MCEQCAGPIDRASKRSDSGGSPIRFCSVCILDRKRASYTNWLARDTNREFRNQHQRQYRTNHPDKAFDWLLKSRYGITIEDYNRMLLEQGGCCAICESPEPRTGNQKHFQVDHDHACCPRAGSCGTCIRGLLCGVCNKMLGAINDDVGKLQAAIQYLSGQSCREPID